MRILGLTGSIAMGKTTAARQFRQMKIPVHDADAAVHRLMQMGGAAVAALASSFPDAVRDGAIDRATLRAIVQRDPASLSRLETILHPLVRNEQRRFLQRQRRARRPLVVMDIPLLYETGGDRFCDAVIVVSAPARVQWQRLMRRAGMTPDLARTLLARQMSDAEKRCRADIVIPTGNGRRLALTRLRRAVKASVNNRRR